MQKLRIIPNFFGKGDDQSSQKKNSPKNHDSKKILRVATKTREGGAEEGGGGVTPKNKITKKLRMYKPNFFVVVKAIESRQYNRDVI
mgnify:CR=1 FL=1